MNNAISVELQFFLTSVLSGAILLLIYDVLRIIRRLIKHDSFFIALEDLFFWVGASLFIFAMMYKENDGIIRGFSIMGMAIGMVLFHYIVSDLLVNLITKLIHTLISPVVFAVNKVKIVVKMIWNRGKKIMNFLIRRLKKWTKSVRIALNKRKQAVSAKRRKHLDETMLKKQKEKEMKQVKKQGKKKAVKNISNKKIDKQKSDRRDQKRTSSKG